MHHLFSTQNSDIILSMFKVKVSISVWVNVKRC
jgi:hypothetical protein